MQRFLAIIALVFLSSSQLMAQEKTTTDAPRPISKPSRDFVLLQFGYTSWTVRPDSVDPKPFAYTFNGYLCYDFPIKKTHFSFAAGVGIGTTSVYMDKQQLALSDTGMRGADATFITDTANYKRYKFNTAYLQAPFELRYFGNIDNRNKGFKAAIGLQVGTLLGAHTKALRSVEGANIKDKMNTKRYISPWNFAATARIGWGNFSVFGSYNITPVFKDKAGPPITPMTIGICLSGL